MKSQADSHRKDRSFEIGEWVFVKLRAHRQQSVVTRIHAKLAARYYGPYPIIDRIGAVAYKLRLPEGSKVHPVFHVSLLKKAIGNYQEEEPLPTNLEGEAVSALQPERVLAERKIKEHGEEVQQWLVQWQGRKAEEATWEEVSLMRSQFPLFNLEDKIDVSEGGVDRDHVTAEENNDVAEGINHDAIITQRSRGPQVWRVYTRRGKKDNTQ
jgi:hypothetical protein